MTTDPVAALSSASPAPFSGAGPGGTLSDAVSLLREAAGFYEARDRTDAAALLRRLAHVLGGGDDTDLSEADIDRLMEAAAPVELVTTQALATHVTRSIFALKTPSPDGSAHYQSGWDDGLEAAMDAARDALAGIGDFAIPSAAPFGGHSCAESGCSGEPGQEEL